MRESVTAYWAKPFGVKLKDVFMTSFPRASHQPAAFCVLLLDITCSFHCFSCCYEISVIISGLWGVVKRENRYRFHIKMSTLNSTFFHVFIVLPFCTIRSLFYCIFSLLGSAIVRLPLLPASHAPYFRSYASCFTSSSNSSPAE